MKTYIKTREANRIVRSYRTSNTPLSEPWIEVDTSYSKDDVLKGEFLFAYENGSLEPTEIPRHQPAPYMQWNHDTGVWEDNRTLEDVKAHKWEEIKKSRESARFSPFQYNGNIYDADARSQQNIQAAAQAAQLEPDLVFDWTMYDNTVTQLGASEVTALSVALVERANEIYAKARQLRQTIDEAKTYAQVSNIYWDSDNQD